MVKSLPAMQETWVLSLGWEDPLEKEMTTHSSNLVWKIPRTEEPGRYSPWGHKESDMTEWLHFNFDNLCFPSVFCTGSPCLLLVFFFLFFYLQWILSYIEIKQPWVYMCSPSRSPLPPPSPPEPSRSSQCTRSKRLSHASNLGWWSLSP